MRQWVVDPSDTAVLDTTRAPMLTLTTCNPRFEATSRLVVRAALLERVPRGAKVPTRAATAAMGHRQPVYASGSATGPAQAPAVTATAVGQSTVGAQTSAPRSAGTIGAEKPGPVRVSAGSSTSSSGEGSPTVGTASAAVGQGESGSAGGWGWVSTVGFLLLAFLGWVVTRVFATHLRRHSKFAVLAAGAIVCLVPLWFAFAHLVDLLPSNI